MPSKCRNCNNLLILLWKNMQLQLAHILQTIIIIGLPICVALLLLYVTYKSPPRSTISKPEETFDPRNIENTLNVSYIFYSPKNALLEAIIQDVTFSLQGNASVAFANDFDMEKALIEMDAFVGIEFDNSFSTLSELPLEFSIALRFPDTLRTSRGRTWDSYDIRPQTRNSYDYSGYDIYFKEGFLAVQAQLSEACIKHRAAQRNIAVPKVQMQRFPERAYTRNKPSDTVPLLPFAIMCSFCYPCMSITLAIMFEKERQLKEILQIMGLSNWLQWIAWFIKSFILLAIPALIFTIIITCSSNLSPLYYSNTIVILLIMIVYIIDVISFAFLITAFCTRSTVAGFLCCGLFIATIVPVLMSKGKSSYGDHIGYCFCLNSGLALILAKILFYETTLQGLTFSTIFETEYDNMSVAMMLFLMLLCSFLCLLICFYIEQLFPGDYGIARKWYFPCTLKFWGPRKSRESRASDRNWDEEGAAVSARRLSKAFEAEPTEKPKAVEARHLRKVFGIVEAVKDFNANFYQDEITVLLGHNGAGKTTTFMMLIGMYQPTSGSAIINGYNMATSTTMARQSLSICPQHNVLYDELTVSQHIKFFSLIKGVPKKRIAEETNKYLEKLNLIDKAKTKTKALSGGMKRKLSVCCALCGDTKVVFCDEPSSGLDPSARRDLWNLLQSEKAGRCILLTTHYMDEAEVLADRIVIMCNGEIRGYGTPFFLEENLGTGYHLVCVKMENCDVDSVTKFLARYIKNIEIESELGQDLTYRLPMDNKSIFPDMFKDLESHLDILRLSGFGLNPSNLAEIFMIIGTENMEKVSRNRNSVDWMHRSDFYEQRYPSKCCNQWLAMMKKKWLYTLRNKWMFILLILIPLILHIIYLLKILTKPDSQAYVMPLKMDLTTYPNAAVVMSRNGSTDVSNKIAQQYESIAKSDADVRICPKDVSLEEYMLRNDEVKRDIGKRSYVAGTSIEDNQVIAWFNPQMTHSLPVALNLVYNAIARSLVATEMEIKITNKPRLNSALKKIDSDVFEQFDEMSITFVLIMYLCVVTAIYALLPVGERSGQFKMQQMISGLSEWIYWMSHLIWDYMIFLIIVAVLLVIMRSLTTRWLLAMAFLLCVFGLAAILMTYLMSMIFSKKIWAMSTIMFTNLLMGDFIGFVWITLETISQRKKRDGIIHLFMLHPHFAMCFAAVRVFLSSFDDKFCEKKTDDEKNFFCFATKKCCEIESVFKWMELYYLALCALICFLILTLICCFGQLIKRFLGGRTMPAENNPNEDEDVRQEREIVKDMTVEDRMDRAIVLDSVTKKYGNFVAVRNISMQSRSFECFGLIGLNGAGKSSTFEMIVAQRSISWGNIYIKGYNVKTDRRRCYQHLGYCSQGDAFFDFLTGRETLHIICLLIGYKRKVIRKIIEHLGNSFKFTNYLDRQTRYYSGGTKRKLNTAIATLGPTLVCLDEPTAGIDPGATREIWDVLADMRDTGKALLLTSHSMEECEALCSRLAIMVNGEFCCIGSQQYLKNRFQQGIVIKIKVGNKEELYGIKRMASVRSHSQSPASNLQYVNASTQTKTNWDTDSLAEDTEDVDEEESARPNNTLIDAYDILIENVETKFKNEFPALVTREKYVYRGMITFQIPEPDLKLSRIFGFIEGVKDSLQILNYSISQATIEEIFLSFAKNQNMAQK